MENTIRTNRWAIVSFISGLIAFLILGALLLQGVTAFQGPWPDPASPIMDAVRSGLDLCTFLSLLTGILALRDIRRKGGLEKGKTLAWVGISLGVGGRLLIAAFFILGMLFSLR